LIQVLNANSYFRSVSLVYVIYVFCFLYKGSERVLTSKNLYFLFSIFSFPKF